MAAGPDTEYVNDIAYDVDPDKRAIFHQALQRYLPVVKAGDLMPAYAGIRPKLQGPADSFRDFHIAEASSYGAPNLINLLGIESPGLTAGEAIAEEIYRIIH